MSRRLIQLATGVGLGVLLAAICWWLGASLLAAALLALVVLVARLLVTGSLPTTGLSGSRLLDMPAELLQRKQRVLQHDLSQLESALELQRSVFEVSADLVSCVEEMDARRRFLAAMRAYWDCSHGDLFIWERGSWRCIGADPSGSEPTLVAAVRLPDAELSNLVLDLSPGVEGQAALILRNATPQPNLRSRGLNDQRYIAEVLRGLLALSLRRVMLYQRLQDLGRLDPLTSCFRRWYGEQRLQELVDADTVVSVAMLDIDHFKNVNDVHGHAAGDQVLAAVGACLRGSLRTGDICARYGGEEFLVVLPATSGETSLRVADRLRRTVASLSDLPQAVTISIGVASCHIDETVPSLLQRCDQALYEAKNGGRDRVLQAEADRHTDAQIRTKTKWIRRPSGEHGDRAT
jgi:diguanylate cyclase (GGDEF)-like protein